MNPPKQDTVAAPTPQAQPPAPTAPPPWDDSPLPNKITLIVLLAAAGGVLIGTLDSYYTATSHWPLWAALAAWTGALAWLGQQWVCQPFQRLLTQLKRVKNKKNPSAMKSLPIDRTDEVGQLAHWVNWLANQYYQDTSEAKRLRRKLDHSVEKATRQATHELRKMAMHDPLTGLGNRRFLKDNLETLTRSAWTTGTELACVAIDMDNFKAVNDTLGHATGDKLLIFLADLIRGNKRHEDYGVRLGGDEFIVIMPGCDRERAAAFGEQVVSLFRQYVRTTLTQDCQASVSIGIATLQEGHTTGKQLLHAADQRLYTAKEAGKGVVVCS